MQEFIGEQVMVEVRLREEENPLPLAFSWRGQRFAIESWGRERDQTQGDTAMHCYMVQTPGPETWELCLEKKKAQWTLRRRWARQPRRV
jgi:hypothetical protein